MKRVLFVDHVDRILGGAEVNLLELLDRLPSGLGWDVACACHPQGSLADALKTVGVKRHDYRAADVFNTVRVVGRNTSWSQIAEGRSALRTATKELEGIVRVFAPDVVISCTNKDHFAVGGVNRPLMPMMRVPSVWWFNDILSPAFFALPFRAAFAWRARRHAARVVAVSEHARRSVVRHGVPGSRAVTIHNGIPLDKYTLSEDVPRWRPPGVKQHESLIGIVGRITPWKGQDLFLDIASSWLQHNAETHFAVIGDAFNEDQEHEQALRATARGTCRPGHVHFVPFQTNLLPVLGGLDVLLHCSTRPEPFGRVVIEAMAAGVPVIAARSGGVPEIITHGKDGLLAEAGSLPDYLEQLGRLVRDAALRSGIRAEARRTVRERFDIARVRGRFNELIREVTGCA